MDKGKNKKERKMSNEFFDLSKMGSKGHRYKNYELDLQLLKSFEAMNEAMNETFNEISNIPKNNIELDCYSKVEYRSIDDPFMPSMEQ